MRLRPDEQPLSAAAYASVALAGLVIAIGMLVFFVREVPKLHSEGMQNQLFYILLIPWGLACAAFLFGVLRGYARLRYKHLGLALDLGGPVVVFCLVVVGGFKLVPAAASTFDLTVRAHSDDGSEPIISRGKVTVDFGTDRRSEPFASNGEANFKGLPAEVQNEPLKVLPQVDGYKSAWEELPISAGTMDIALTREQAHTTFTIVINPRPPATDKLDFVINGQHLQATGNGFGTYTMLVNGKPDDHVMVQIYENDNPAYDDYQTLPGPVTLQLRRR